ncbi:GlcG/HbpS family heme-binding protein [Neptunomonas marina]|uniref:Heme-binding protein n=1 Tax=Neptunomonas marina TaxID=1815562 RepID=A0A437Q979_9GAMM|nr:heme-binding protein [Neptunomonas marina]RVU31065.1 heme-binding protein [Neptunomonas marina]
MRFLTSSTLALLLMTTSHSYAESRPFLTAADALNGLQGCYKMAEKNGWNLAITIIDRGANTVSSLRMDNALSAASTGAELKAQTALAWGSSTSRVAEIVKKKPEFNQFPGLLPIAGGEPITAPDGTLIGAVGVAGGLTLHDQECAKAAVAAMQ